MALLKLNVDFTHLVVWSGRRDSAGKVGLGETSQVQSAEEAPGLPLEWKSTGKFNTAELLIVGNKIIAIAVTLLIQLVPK